MVEWGRGGGRSRGRAETWPPAAARRRRALAWTGGLTDFGRAAAARIRQWAIDDTPRRSLPFGRLWLGIAIILPPMSRLSGRRDWRSFAAAAAAPGAAWPALPWRFAAVAAALP
jgi:hypothetical protein